MKLSTLEKPRPTWKVPVDFSFTSTWTMTWPLSMPGLCETSTDSKKPSWVTLSLLRRIPEPEKSSPSKTRNCRRITLSRV